MATLKALALSLSLLAVFLFAILALFLTWRRSRKNIAGDDSTEFFLTAKKSIPLWRIAWSFFASATGSWIVYAVPAFVVDSEFGAGYIGLISYSVFTGLPLVIVAMVGEHIRNRYPTVLSWGDFCQKRFGTATQVAVSLIVLLNMAINLCAEYTAVGELFSQIVGVNAILPILVIGILTMIYTSVGGLYVSIVTDQFQGIFSILLLLVTAVYIAVTFRLPDPLPDLGPILGANYAGWSSIGTLGISLTCATFFSDAIWQRVWASADRRTLLKGSSLGALLATIMAFFFGFGGFLAAWGGVMGDDSNLAFFDLLSQGGTNPHIWIVVVIVILAAVMNESAVDAYQSALTDTVVALATCLGVPRLLKRDEFPLMPARFLTLVINIPIMIVATRGYRINQLYLIPNMITSCATLPILLGLIPRIEGYVHGGSVIFGTLFSLFSVMVHGRITAGDWKDGIVQNFYTTYLYDAFLTALISSVVGVAVWAVGEWVVRRALGWPTWVVRDGKGNGVRVADDYNGGVGNRSSVVGGRGGGGGGGGVGGASHETIDAGADGLRK
ncbi:hypothetical protein HKX48_005905 [Thoreauomyces humboldtii]|nr:hypothetical protein HKX48_005905 [Thoreauomyces humboldtii]